MNILRISIERPVFVTMIALFLATLGILALRSLPLDLYPNISYPILAVRTDLPGAAPEEIEQLITKRIEDNLSTIAGIKTIRSMSREGTGFVLLEFDIGADIRYQEAQVRAKLSNMRNSLPDDMSDPVVVRQDPDDTPIMEISLTGPLTAAELSDIADQVVAKKLRQIEGVGDLDLAGARYKEVSVSLRPALLDQWKLNATEIVQAISRANRNDPVGKLEGSESTWVARSLSQAKTEHELGTIAIGKTTDGNSILLRDVADIKMGYAKTTRISRIHDEEGLHPAISIDILKQSGENTVAISSKVRKTLDEISQKLPSGVSLRVARDNADLVRDNVADVYESLIIAAILTIVVVLLFLQSYRSTLTTGLALPSSVITTFVVMAAAGFTVNILTLLALSLSIGLLVDDAIVVRENIYRHLRDHKKAGKEAAFDGAREVVLAVVATTAVLVAVFLPVAFMGGLAGQFFKSFALTVVFAMLISLWDSLTMAPMLSAYFANIPNPAHEWAIFGKSGLRFYAFLEKMEKAFFWLEKKYENILRWLLPRWYIALLAATFSIALAMWGFRVVPKNLVPAQLATSFRVNLEGPMAIQTSVVDKVALEVDKRIEKLGLFTWWTLTAGGGHTGNSSVNLSLRIKPEHSKSQKSLAEVRQKTRQALKDIPGFSTRIAEPADPLSGATGGGRFMPIGVSILGDDMGTLTELSQKVRAAMSKVPGLTDIRPFQEGGLPEVRFRTDPLSAGKYGLTASTVSDNLKIWVQGDTSNRLRQGDDQIPIRVQLENGEKLSPDMLLQRPLIVRGGGPNKTDLVIPLGNVVKAEPGAGPTIIIRENRQRMMRVPANIEPKASLTSVSRDLEKQLSEIPLPPGYEVSIVGQNEQMKDTFENVATALIIGSIFVYMVLASLFESFLLPLTVMAAIPLAAIGAVAGLLLFGVPLDIYGSIGMILLAGIVAKNSILLVDFAIVRVRKHNKTPAEAIQESAPLRLRPILMTSFAMIAGMIPVALGIGATGASRQGLGIATIGGVLSSTLLTLLVVPNLFIVMEKISKSAQNFFKRTGSHENASS
jgi:HAE1 family hydrophobic/amphiphilic exporter-1